MAEVFGWVMLVGGSLFWLCAHIIERVSYRRWVRFGEKLQTMDPDEREAAIKKWNGE